MRAAGSFLWRVAGEGKRGIGNLGAKVRKKIDICKKRHKKRWRKGSNGTPPLRRHNGRKRKNRNGRDEKGLEETKKNLWHDVCTRGCEGEKNRRKPFSINPLFTGEKV